MSCPSNKNTAQTRITSKAPKNHILPTCDSIAKSYYKFSFQFVALVCWFICSLLLFNGCTVAMHGIGKEMDAKHSTVSPVEWDNVSKGDNLKVQYSDDSVVSGVVVFVSSTERSLVISPHSLKDTRDDIKVNEMDIKSLFVLKDKTNYKNYLIPIGLTLDFIIILFITHMGSIAPTA